ncbi:MAG: thioredoxin domain-containing protein [Eubacteriales bacterium]|nr:thioredoxin domain-containing protein [Eubacteriales bacterium]
MSNHLKHQTSPYLLQHSENPVDWYPWCDEAFQRAKDEDKPIFLSIGYSTCHWCHVMAHESFENQQTADILNKYFVSIKVDKEERPDIDSIYMSVCQAFTGSGGWPTSIFMTGEQKPFFAGTYFPTTSRYGTIGFKELLLAINEKWTNGRDALIDSADSVVEALNNATVNKNTTNKNLFDIAIQQYKNSFDKKYGGFGHAPKFPSPHNLLFLLTHYEKSGDIEALDMVESTLLQMYRGGIFDHIGFGFSRYSTDKFFLVPHFEKMLYDNALLIMAYCKTYQITKNEFYKRVAEQTATYIQREMTSEDGGFYSAQDADSDGEEGKYYVFEPLEVIQILGKEVGTEFNEYYDITVQGNFEGKSIPNLLNNKELNNEYEKHLTLIYEYRKNRNRLHLDDKILTSWNSLMIAAMCSLYRITQNDKYLACAKKAQQFIEENLSENGKLLVSFRDGISGKRGFLDDYANYTFALLSLYDATLEKHFLEKAADFCDQAISDFYDRDQGGFYLYCNDHEKLIIRPKESYDGAMPSGNSVMTYNLTRIYFLMGKNEGILKQQVEFMSQQASEYPTGYAMFLTSLSDYLQMPKKIVIVLKSESDIKNLPFKMSLNSIIKILDRPTDEYTLKDNKTTFYICENNHCMPPVNVIE